MCCLPHYRWGPGQVGGAGDPHPQVGSGQERKSKVWVWIERVEKEGGRVGGQDHDGNDKNRSTTAGQVGKSLDFGPRLPGFKF